MAVRTRKTYVSKGQRPNVSRKMVNAARRERKACPTLRMLLDQLNFRNELGRRKDKDSRDKYARLLEVEAMQRQAEELFDKYGKAGASWESCVQAVNTNWVANFENKWRDKAAKA